MATVHQELSCPVRELVDDGMMSPRTWNRVGLGKDQDVSGFTFGDVLQMQAPSLDVLVAMKLRWKTMRLREGSNRRQMAATVLYYLTLLTARVRCNAQITSLSDEQLRSGLKWLGSLTWLEDPVLTMVEHLRSMEDWPDVTSSL